MDSDRLEGLTVAMMEGGLGTRLHPPYRVFPIVRNGTLVGGLLFNDFNGANIEWTVFAPTGLSRSAMRFSAQYAFDACHCTRMTARTRRSNTGVKKMLQKAGWIYEGTMQRYYGPLKRDDAHLYRLDREAAERWLA